MFCVDVLHSKCNKLDQNTLPSGPPSQSFITGSDDTSDRKCSTDDTKSDVNVKDAPGSKKKEENMFY